jgi:glutathione peroxidase
MSNLVRYLPCLVCILALAALGCEADESDPVSQDMSSVEADLGEMGADSGAAAADAGQALVDSEVFNLDGGSIVSDGEILNIDAGSGGAMPLTPDGGGDDMTGGFVCDPAAEPGSFHSFNAMGYPDNDDVSMCAYRGRVLLIANTAALCGFTPQYEQLEFMNRQYGRDGLTVLGFLTNDFGDQGGNSDEVEMCTDMYELTFQQFAHIGVTSRSRDGQHPIFEWLTTRPGLEGGIPWNFNKFLVDHEGTLLGRWDQTVSPNDPQIVAAITAALANRPFEPQRD